MLKRRSGGQELGELVSTARNTYVNAGNVAQFDFHQSDKSKVSFPLLSFHSLNELMEASRAWYFLTSVSITSICGRISGCSYNLNIYNLPMSDTETLLTKTCGGLKIRTVVIHTSRVTLLPSVVSFQNRLQEQQSCKRMP